MLLFPLSALLMDDGLLQFGDVFLGPMMLWMELKLHLENVLFDPSSSCFIFCLFL